MARSRDDDDDYDDRPARRPRDDDDYDDRPSSRGGAKGPLDNMYANTNIVVLILFALCCNGIATILSAVAFFTAKDPKAKSNALITMIIGAIVTVIGVGAQVMLGAAAGLQGGR